MQTLTASSLYITVVVLLCVRLNLTHSSYAFVCIPGYWPRQTIAPNNWKKKSLFPLSFTYFAENCLLQNTLLFYLTFVTTWSLQVPHFLRLSSASGLQETRREMCVHLSPKTSQSVHWLDSNCVWRLVWSRCSGNPWSPEWAASCGQNPQDWSECRVNLKTATAALEKNKNKQRFTVTLSKTTTLS